MSKDPLGKLLITPFVVLEDDREQTPWHFRGITRNGKDVVVRSKRQRLRTGDYSIEGLEDRITVERKSVADAYRTFGDGRQRWYREMERMREMDCAWVMVEAGWGAIKAYTTPLSPSGRRFTFKGFRGSVKSWRVRYPNIQWEFGPMASDVEQLCIEVLWRFWELEQEEVKTK